MAEADTAAAAALAESTSESIAQDGASSMPAGVAQGGAAESEPAAPTSRLVITKMRMENFKSYYGVQEVGPFHKCFSSVVGPNGSGKSNVIDAMLFVFGYRAKKIRQSKLKDLIHKSENHRDLDFCRVTVFFQEIVDREDGGFDPLPGTELEVAREANAQSQSVYYLNGRKTNFKELGVLLRSKGIDLDHNRFLILQGEVESIAMMKPKAQTENDDGLLEYLEDIIGSDQFKTDIAEDEGRLAVLNEHRNEKLARVKIMQKEKDGLEAGKREAEDYLRQENELTSQRSKLYQLYRDAARQGIAAVESTLAGVRESFEEQKKELDVKMAEAKETARLHKKEAAQFQKLKATAEKAKADFISFERKDIKFRGDIKFNEKKLSKLAKNMEKDRKTLAESQMRITALQQDLERYATEAQALEGKHGKEEKALDAMLESLKGDIEELQSKLAAAQLELAPVSKARDEAKAAHDLKQAALDLVTKGVRDIDNQITAAETGSQEALALAAQRKTELKPLEARRTEITKQLAAQQAALTKITKEEAPLEVKVKSARAKVEESRSASRQARSTGQVLEALRRQAQRGTIAGFHGRLGDLGTIDDKYDVAVTTACGALNHLVVDTVAQAQACVNFLRTNNVGRATFIILERIQGLGARAQQPFAGPDGSLRLFDLITPKDAKFAVAFYHALQDTLVADTLDEATRIAFAKGKRFRVVSLEGQLIDKSGTMSGGGTRVARGGMSSTLSESVSPAELAQMEKDAEVVVAALGSCRQRRAELEKEVNGLEREANETEAKLKRFTLEVTAMTDKGEALAKQLIDLRKRRTSAVQDEDKKVQLEKELNKLAANLAKADAAAAKIEQVIAGIEEAIADVGGIKLKAQKAKVQGLADELATIQTSTTRSTVELKTANRKVAQLEKKLAEDEAEQESVTAEIEALKASFAGLDEGAKAVNEEMKRASALMEEQEERMNALQATVDAASAVVSSLKSSLIDVEHELGEKERVLRDHTASAKQWDKKLEGLKLHTLDEDDDEDETEIEPAEVNAEAETEDGRPAGKRAKTQAVLEELSEEALEALDQNELQCAVTMLEEKLKQLKPNMAAIREYRKKEQDYLARVQELDAVTSERDTLRRHFEDLRKQRLDMFMAGFLTITTKLKEMYQMITLGGDAELELVDRLNPFSEGIVFSVRPPKKSWKNISNLSGGEKTLSSLALVFALHHFKPTPLYVMDEIDAALDFKNVSIVANYIKERTKNAQFIIISLRNNMFELADRLIGIYKTDNATKTVTINPDLVAAQASALNEARVMRAAPAAEVDAAAAETLPTVAVI